MKKIYFILSALLMGSGAMFAQTETEPNDGINNANAFTAPIAIDASITNANDDFFKITLPICNSWAFTIINNSGQGNLNVTFYNAQNLSNTIINSGGINYNFNSGLPTPIILNCSGTVWVKINQTSGTDIGNYLLQILPYTNGDVNECNNDFPEATILTSVNINGSFDAKLWGYNFEGNPDADYFTYTPSQCGVLKAIVTGQNGSADLQVNIYDDAEPTKHLITSLALNGNYGALLEANQKYYVVITDGVSGGNNYELFDDAFTVTTSYDTSDIYECNNTFITAAPLPIGTSFDIKLWGQNSQINIPDSRPQDADYFTYTPSQCGVLKAIVTGQNGSADLQVNIYDDAQPTKHLITSLALNGNYGALLEANQKYYVVITDGVSGGNNYELFDDAFTVTTSYDTSDIYECNNTFITAAPLPIGTSFDIKLWGQNSQINIPDSRPQDADYFTYTPSQCGVLKAIVTGQNGSADLQVNIYDDAQPTKHLITSLALNGNYGALLEANQKYYMVITDGVSGGNNYELFDDAFTVTTSYDTSDIYECNNTFITAAPLPIGTSFDIKLWGQNSQINIPDNRPQDADYFTYTPTNCVTLNINLTSINAGADLRMSLFKDELPVPVLLTTVSNNLLFNLEANQKYYIVITDGVSGGNNYELFDDAFTVTTSTSFTATFPVPIITLTGGQLTTQIATGNIFDWYINGVSAPGNNTDSSYTPTQNGSYTVCVSDASQSCGTLCSAPFEFSLKTFEFEIADISISPNPTTGLVTLKNLPVSQSTIYEVYNSLGQKTQSGQLKNQSIKIDGPDGEYILKIKDGVSEMTRKIILKK